MVSTEPCKLTIILFRKNERRNPIYCTELNLYDEVVIGKNPSKDNDYILHINDEKVDKKIDDEHCCISLEKGNKIWISDISKTKYCFMRIKPLIYVNLSNKLFFLVNSHLLVRSHYNTMLPSWEAEGQHPPSVAEI